MARKSRPKEIDGFTSIQAVRRSGRASRQARLRPSSSHLPERPPQEETAAPAERKARIGQTALPQKHEIVCYECGYGFSLRGKVDRTYCPKCRCELEFKNITIEGEGSRTVKTIGTVEIASGAVVTGGEIIANNVVIAGDATAVDIRAVNRLELDRGARYDVSRGEIKDLVIRERGKFRFTRRIACRDLDIRGELNAKVAAQGRVTVHAGGLLKGEIGGAHLCVEDGGGLSIKADIRPQQGSGKPPEKPAAGTRRRRKARSAPGR